jgi:hypothetical protein
VSAEHRSPFIPALLLALAVLGWTCYQTFQLVTGRNNLTAGIAAQDPQMEQSKKVRAALESIITRTANLAKSGNANATVIVDELRKRGVNVNPESQPQPAAPAQ